MSNSINVDKYSYAEKYTSEISEDGYAKSLFDTEKTARTAADTVLQTAINTETSNRQSADNAINVSLSAKVDKITGKGLSSNDFTNEYKQNVDSNTSMRHTHSNKSVLDTITAADKTKLDGIDMSSKEDKSTIVNVTSSTTLLALENNKEYRISTMPSSLEFTLPSGSLDEFICIISFATSTNAPSITYPSGIKWSGDSVVSGEFISCSHLNYTIGIWWDGINFNGAVRSV